MKLIRQKEFSKKPRLKDILITSGLIGTGIGLGTSIKPNKITGKEVRYHNTDAENVDDILENGIKTKFAEDPNNLTNKQRNTKDIDIKKKKGLVYVSHSKSLADQVGIVRGWHTGKYSKDMDYKKAIDEERKNPKNSKTLKLILDYEKDIKGNLVENPETLGAKSAKEYLERNSRMKKLKYAKRRYKVLTKDTETLNHDISPERITESKKFKKRDKEDFKNYVKNNPKRFGTEMAKLVGSGALISSGLAYGIKKLKR